MYDEVMYLGMVHSETVVEYYYTTEHTQWGHPYRKMNERKFGIYVGRAIADMRILGVCLETAAEVRSIRIGGVEMLAGPLKGFDGFGGSEVWMRENDAMIVEVHPETVRCVAKVIIDERYFDNDLN